MKETSLCSDEEYKELRAKVMKAFLSPSPGTAVPMSPAGDDLFTWDVAVLRRKDAQMRYPWARAYVEIAEELERIENDFAAPNCWDRMRTAVEDRARSMPLTLLESIVYNQLLFTGNVEKGAHSLLSLMMSPVQDRTLPLHNYMVLQGYNPSERRTLIERGLALDVPLYPSEKLRHRNYELFKAAEVAGGSPEPLLPFDSPEVTSVIGGGYAAPMMSMNGEPIGTVDLGPLADYLTQSTTTKQDLQKVIQRMEQLHASAQAPHRQGQQWYRNRIPRGRGYGASNRQQQGPNRQYAPQQFTHDPPMQGLQQYQVQGGEATDQTADKPAAAKNA
eukprot:gene1894-biopygen1570